MKRILLFSLPILIIVSVAFAVFGFFQARSIQERLIDEIKSKAKAVTESMELSAGQILATRDIRKAQRLIERFETRERLQGCVLYDREGKLFVITQDFRNGRIRKNPISRRSSRRRNPTASWRGSAIIPSTVMSSRSSTITARSSASWRSSTILPTYPRG